MGNKNTFFLKNFGEHTAVFFLYALTILPFIQIISEKIFQVPLLGMDLFVVHIVFLFACFTAVITWMYDKHIAIAAIDELAPKKIMRGIIIYRAILVPLILVAIFFSALSEFFVIFSPDERAWGIPLQWFFIFLPLSYLGMIILSIMRHKQERIFAILGIILGLFISTGPISGVLYYLFKIEQFGVLTPISEWWLLFAAKAFPFLIIILILSAFIGIPLFVILSAVSYVAFSQGGGYVEMLSLEAYGILTDKSIAAIPLFTIAGYILSKGSAGQRLVEVFRTFFGWFRGGGVIATVIVTSFFTTFTGVSGVTILALGSLLTIVLTGSGYKTERAESLITASGALGLLFPPSLAIIMYGTTNYFSVDVFAVFKGAIIPGLILAVSMIVLGIYYDKNPLRLSFSFPKAIHALKQAGFELLLPVFIIVGYFSGIFTLFQTAAFAVLYTIIIGTFIRKDYSLTMVKNIIIESLPVTGGILCIFGAAKGLSYFLLDAGIPQLLSDFVLTFVESKLVFLMLLNLVLIIVGALMDVYSAILIVSPLIIPIAESFGINPVHTAIIFLMNMQLGFLTPPVGMDLFIASYTFNKPVMRIVKGILPFLLVQFIVLLLITYIPWFTTVLL